MYDKNSINIDIFDVSIENFPGAVSEDGQTYIINLKWYLGKSEEVAKKKLALTLLNLGESPEKIDMIIKNYKMSKPLDATNRVARKLMMMNNNAGKAVPAKPGSDLQKEITKLTREVKNSA